MRTSNGSIVSSPGYKVTLSDAFLNVDLDDHDSWCLLVRMFWGASKIHRF